MGRERKGPGVVKLISCSTQLQTKFILFINVKWQKNFGNITFISVINTTYAKLIYLSVL